MVLTFFLSLSFPVPNFSLGASFFHTEKISASMKTSKEFKSRKEREGEGEIDKGR